MRNSPLVRKATLFIPTGPVEHLHVVMNNATFYPVLGNDTVLVVNFCSIKPGVPYDATCELANGEHRFVTRRTFIDYRHAALLDATKLRTGIASGELHTSDPVSERLYARVLDGFGRSPAVAPKLKRFIHFALDRRL